MCGDIEVFQRRAETYSNFKDEVRGFLDERPELETKKDKIAALKKSYGCNLSFPETAAAIRVVDCSTDYWYQIRINNGAGFRLPDDVEEGEAYYRTQYRRQSETSKKERETVLERDAASCLRCGQNTDLEVHHIEPIGAGGSNKLSNLATLCRSCHNDAHAAESANVTYSDFWKWIESG